MAPVIARFLDTAELLDPLGKIGRCDAAPSLCIRSSPQPPEATGSNPAFTQDTGPLAISDNVIFNPIKDAQLR